MMKTFDVSVAVFVRGLTNLKGLLTKGEAYASANGREPASLLNAQLADRMYTLAVQVYWAAEGAKLGVDRLIGVASPPVTEEAKTFAELDERIDAAIAYLGAIDPDALESGLDRTITIPHRGGVMEFRGDRFLTEFVIPSFFFHLTTAYGILRHEGVPIQKGDFLGA
jgi:hypothetical protein